MEHFFLQMTQMIASYTNNFAQMSLELAIKTLIVIGSIIIFRKLIKRALLFFDVRESFQVIWSILKLPFILGLVSFVILSEVANFFRDFNKSNNTADIIELILTVRYWIIYSLVLWFVFRFIRVLETDFKVSIQKACHRLLNKKMNMTDILFCIHLIKICSFIIFGIIFLNGIGFALSALLTFGGMGTLVVGFASRDILSNLFSGVLIHKDRPFIVGEWIKIDALNLEGTVKKIGWRNTEVTTFDQRPLYVPNQLLMNNVIENPQRMTHRRIKETISVRYEDIEVLPKLLDAIRCYIHENPEIENEKIRMVHLNEYAESSVNFFIYVMTKTTNWKRYHEVKEEVLLAIADIIKKHGVDFASPTVVEYPAPKIIR